ncbi:hypothetical protein [Winogradskyella sp. PG-2]|uniref:hypothetical protein n=1 Tax=Winogradskyella sp. PG-2 TaxID=754409 RepID=UPI0004587BEB|nr:hypothetical protein [Winogradskyella sp. PG-2]BAO77632.1 hypothetical protein WPG_3402 [Winogradskyella sp. PG-2]
MKKIVSFLTVFALLLTACEGPQGPPGFDGFDGLDGEIIASSAFEIELDFIEADNYEFIEAYGFDVLPTDVTLVYILWETLNGQDVWRLVPQTVQFNDGNLVYNYDFTQTDVRFFLDGTTDFTTLDDAFTLAQVFRVVVVPADNVGRTDITDINNVISKYNIESFPKR